MTNIGTPSDSIVAVRKFFTWRLRSSSIAGSSRGPFHAAVPTAIVIGAVAVLFTVGVVMFVVVRNEIVEREAVVTGDEIDALLRLAAFVAIDLVAAEHAIGHAARRTRCAAEEIDERRRETGRSIRHESPIKLPT